MKKLIMSIIATLLTLSACAAAGDSPNIVFIGNSITYGANHADHTMTAPPNACAEWLSAHDGVEKVYFLNAGKPGKTTFHFLPDRSMVVPAGDPSYFSEVVEATRELVALHPGRPLIFSVMLGTNDSADRPKNNATTKEQYVDNMTAIIDSLLAIWPSAHVVLNKPIYYTPGFITVNGTVMDDVALGRIGDYYNSFPEILAKCKEGHVHIGDSLGFDYFSNNWKTDIVEEKDRHGKSYWLHPNEKGAKVLGELWGRAMLPILSEIQTDMPVRAGDASASCPGKTPVYIVAGQSNTDGRAALEEMPEKIREYVSCGGATDIMMSYCNGISRRELGRFVPYVPMYEGNSSERCGFDAILYSMLTEHSSQPIYVIKESKGGTAIDTLCQSSGDLYWCADQDWMNRVGQAEYDRDSQTTVGKSLLLQLEANIDSCINSTLSKLPNGYEFKGIIWHQGESDRPQGQNYYDNLRKLISHLRQHIASSMGDSAYLSLPFIAGGVNSESRQYSKEVEDAKIRLAQEDPDVWYVNMDGCELRKDDRLHFNGDGCREAAERVFHLIRENAR